MSNIDINKFWKPKAGDIVRLAWNASSYIYVPERKATTAVDILEASYSCMRESF